MNMQETAPRRQESLIRDSQQGDGEAFAELLLPYKSRLMAYLSRFLPERMLAEDALQETLVKVWRSLPRYRHRGRFDAWLFGVAYSCAHDALRKQKVRANTLYTESMPEPEIAERPDELLEAGELAEALQALINELPEHQRQVFLLRQHGELSYKEIATLMKQSQNTVLSHMHYAMQKVKKFVKRYHEEN